MAEYHEDGIVMDVNILSDNSDNEWERYELEVVGIKQENGIYKSPEIGEKFTCEKKKGVCCGGLWHLFN